MPTARVWLVMVALHVLPVALAILSQVLAKARVHNVLQIQTRLQSQAPR